MKSTETYTRWFVYVVAGAAALLLIVSIVRVAIGDDKASAADLARREEVVREEAARKAKVDAVRKEYEDRQIADDKALLASLGSIECNVTLKHNVKDLAPGVAAAYRQQNIKLSGEIVKFAEVYLRSRATDQVLTYVSDADFRLNSDSRSDENRSRAFILLRPQAERCLAEFAGGQRDAQLGRSNTSVGFR